MWIVDDSNESDCDDDMVLDEREGQQEIKYSEFDGDAASLRFGDSEKETDNDVVTMIILKEHRNMFLQKLYNWIKKMASIVFQLAHMLGCE